MSSTQLVGGESTSLDDPTDLSRADYIAAFKRAFKEIKGDDVPGLAAGVAFKMFLSLFPALLAAVAIFTLVTTVAELQEWLRQAQGFLPQDAIDLIERPLKRQAEGDGGAGFAAIGGIAAGLWAATSAAVSLMKALSHAYDVDESRKFLRQRLIALALTVALLVALIGVIVLLVLGPQLQSFLLGEVQAPITWVLAALRLAMAFAVLVVLFAFVYWIGPDRDHPSWVWMSPGALFGVVGWLLVSGGFTLYAQTAGSYGATYGTIAGVVVLLIWLQLSMLVILVGAEFNAEVERSLSLRLAVRDGAGMAATAPAAAVLPDQEAGATTITQAQSSAHSVELARTWDPEASVDLGPRVLADPVPPRSPSEDAGSSSPAAAGPAVSPAARQAGAMVAMVTVAGVVLGFARRRKRG